MRAKIKGLLDGRWLTEAFVLVNVAFLSADIYLAHSVNQFRHPAEYVPLYFSMVAPIVLLAALAAFKPGTSNVAWRDLGLLVGCAAILVGCVGVVLHLESQFFIHRTLKSLVYAAPFAAPLAYTGLGLLLLMNRMVDHESTEWAYWVLLLALGGFVGNFVFSVTDHAQNGFYHATEWIPVFSSALAVGFLSALFLVPVERPFLRLCAGVLLLQAAVGALGFALHAAANLEGVSASRFDNFVYGAPAMAPLLFPNLVLLAFIGLWALGRKMSAAETVRGDLTSSGPAE
jgi:hypothetical protein